MKKRMLVVDDTIGIQSLLKDFLTGNGYTVDVAENGQTAMDLLELNAGNYLCVLTDIDMPVVDGITLGNYIAHKFRHLPVIAITGEINYSDLDKLMKSHFEAVITKPFDLDEVLEEIQHVAVLNS